MNEMNSQVLGMFAASTMFQLSDTQVWDVSGSQAKTGESELSPEDVKDFRDLLDEKTQTASKPQSKSETPKQEQAQDKTPAKEEEQPVQVREDPQATYRRLVDSGALAQVDAQFAPETPVVVSAQPQEVEALAQTPVAELPEVQEVLVDTAGAPELSQPVTEQGETQPMAQAAPEQAQPQAVETQTQPQLEQVRPQQGQEEAQPVEQAEQSVETQTPEEEESADVTGRDAQPEPLFRDVKAAPVKVGETYEARQTEETAPVNDQISGQLVQALAQGESKVEIQLSPANLGSVKVEITRTAEGLIHVTLNAENSQTRSLLEKHVQGLQSMLTERTQDNVQVEVQKQGESQRNDHPYDGHNGQERQQQEQERQQRRQEDHRSSQDFMQQLRLGLISVEEIA